MFSYGLITRRIHAWQPARASPSLLPMPYDDPRDQRAWEMYVAIVAAKYTSENFDALHQHDYRSLLTNDLLVREAYALADTFEQGRQNESERRKAPEQQPLQEPSEEGRAGASRNLAAVAQNPELVQMPSPQDENRQT
jgi:hypothetical protein